MKNVIYYFTSTGNSLEVARQIADRLGDAQLIGIAHALQANTVTITADTVGIVFPVYCWGLPRMVYEFASRVKIKSAYVYGVTTYGGCPGDALIQLQQLLALRQISLQSGFGIRLPGNYTPLYGAQPQKTQDAYFKKAELSIAKISAAVKAQVRGKIAWGPWIVSALIRVTKFHTMFLKQVQTSDKTFMVQDTCDGCGICAKVCPAQNIKLVAHKPVWQHVCENCMGCLQWCPQEAIQYGKVTIGRTRYQHPAIKLKDIVAQKK